MKAKPKIGDTGQLRFVVATGHTINRPCTPIGRERATVVI
jgi:hypothetical protein